MPQGRRSGHTVVFQLSDSPGVLTLDLVLFVVIVTPALHGYTHI